MARLISSPSAIALIYGSPALVRVLGLLLRPAR
jgi:hypothetical protein